MILRPVEKRDLPDLVTLARQLDSMNLPGDPEFLERQIHASLAALRLSAGEVRTGRADHVYVFMLEDTDRGRCVGSSQILAKHGSPESPHYWLEVSTEERHSRDLGRRFVHTKLRLRSSEDGPTEIGGLILDPSYRRHPGKWGKALSVVRFAYMSAHPERFKREVIAEMLSPFEAPGQNLLWDAFGARFTGLRFREADHLSARSKRFIADLFPRDPVYVSLFSERVQAMIGTTGETAKPAVRILESVGFRYLHQVDPFDGGPYYGAARDAISSVRDRRELVLPCLPEAGGAEMEGPLALLSAEAALGFRATVVPLSPDGAPVVSAECREALGVKGGDRVAVTPLP
ncbi:MAG TPA: arginine N-succinyltransferase [Myxococcota bacterium]|nr:arginine N-succinyltransferase [Myxococcota bacterium]